MSIDEDISLDAVSTPLPWQREAWERVVAQASTGRLPHALLLSGEAGSGRQRFATALSRYLLCQSPVHGTNCGECKTCILSRTQGHGDWRWLGPAGKSRSIGIDQVRDVIRFTAQTSGLGAYKVLVLSPADGMTLAAANAFLKCLEEPAPNTLILMITRSASAVPATIRSRCQQLPLPAPDVAAALAWLTLVSGDDGMAQRALAAAEGRPLDAFRLMHDNDALESAERRETLLSDLFASRADPAEVASVLSSLEAGAAVETVLMHLHRRLRRYTAASLREPDARALMALDARLRDVQRAISGGATPQRELLSAALVAQLGSILGTGSGEC